MENRTPATTKMAAEVANLAFETKVVNFSKKGKFDNTNKNNGNLNSNGPLDNGAFGSDGKAAQNDSQALKCNLCDGNHKRINCSQNKTEHFKMNLKINSILFKFGKRQRNSFLWYKFRWFKGIQIECVYQG